MKSILTTTALGSAIVFGGIFAATVAPAQDSGNQPCVGENCPVPGGDQGKKPSKSMEKKTPDESTDQTMTRKKRIQGAEQDQGGDQTMTRKKRITSKTDVDVDVRVGAAQGVRSGSWHFDPSVHHRRRSKSVSFSFYYGGWWYPQPYWRIYNVRPYRISCGEGRAIVSERFNRVRVVECNGGTYTYLGRRSGDTFRVLLNARTGRIVGRVLI